jgi:hypothetical protein
MKRSFRAATVFAGVAALGTALAPAAHAASPHPEAGNCPRSWTGTTWVVLRYSSRVNHPSDACVWGNEGYVGWAPGNRFSSYCGGAMSGYMWVNGQKKHFTPGGPYPLFNAEVSAVSITGEPGGPTCAIRH